MIKRIWRGWTSVDNADDYEELLTTMIVPGITARRIAGHLGTEILRERDPEGAEVQFVTIMTFDGWDAVREFARHWRFDREFRMRSEEGGDDRLAFLRLQ